MTFYRKGEPFILKKKGRFTMKKRLIMLILSIVFVLSACSNSANGKEQVVIYTNGDEEAVTAVGNALDSAGYEGQYVLQTLGTSELGGKLLAEGGSNRSRFSDDELLFY